MVACVVVVPLLLRPGYALALIVYGPLRPVPGSGGCLRDPSNEPATDQPCPGTTAGLAGVRAVAVSPDGSNVYLAGDGGVVALARDSATGTLQPALLPSARACVSPSSSSCTTKSSALSGADTLAISPDGRFVYVGASNTASVSAFRRASRGVLVPVARSIGAGRGRRHAMPYFGCIAGVPLAGIPPARCAARVPALNGVAALAISPDGRDLYAVSYGLAPGTDSVVTLQRDPRSGGLRPLPGTRGCVQSRPGSGCRALAGLDGASAITIPPDGRFVYVASELSGAVRGFIRNRVTGALTPLYGPRGCISSPSRAADDLPCPVTVRQLAGARSIAVSPDGRDLYVAAFDPGAVVVLRRNPISGALAPSPPDCLQAAPTASCPGGLPTLRGAAALAVAPDGSAVYVVCEGADSLVELLRNQANGALTLASDGPTAVAPLSGAVALALSPRGHTIYLASPFDDGVAGLTSEGPL